MKILWKCLKIFLFLFIFIKLPAILFSVALADALQGPNFQIDELYDVFYALLRLIFLLIYMKLKYGKTKLFVFNKANPKERLKDCIASQGISSFFAIMAILIALIIANFIDLESLLDLSSSNIENNHIALKLFSDALLIPIYEELLFRGHLLNETVNLSNRFHVILILSLLFGALHGNPVQALQAGCSAFSWYYMRIKYQDLWGGLIVHCINNTISTLAAFDCLSMTFVSIFIPFTSCYMIFHVLKYKNEIKNILYKQTDEPALNK